jgi:hypothetical protein
MKAGNWRESFVSVDEKAFMRSEGGVAAFVGGERAR